MAPYLDECVLTLSTEVKPLIVKCDIMTITIDFTNCITHVSGTCELPSTAVAEETDDRHKL